ncbi:hypothetical protein D3C87_324720 [compost metagenome]
MGRMTDSYTAYLADWHVAHPSIVQPVHADRWSANKPTGFAEMEIISRSPKYWDKFGIVYKAPNGNIIEATENSIGMAIYAIFETQQDYDNWKRPKTIKELFEQW